MRFRAELRSRWRTWLALALLAGVAGGLVVAGIAGARRTDSALARHLKIYRFPDATVAFSNGPNSIRAVPRLRVLPFFAEGDLGAFRCDPRNQNPYQPGLPTRREVRQILIACPRPRPCDEAKVLIDRLDARLQSGADFATLAKKYSADPSGKL